MKSINPTTLFSCFFFLFFMATFIKAIYLKKQKDLFLVKLIEANSFFDEVKEELKELHNKHNKTKLFKNRLAEAELTTHLQHPRLSAQTSISNSSIPEKYSFVHTLIKKNMGSDEIASILAISEREAEQLVALSNLRQERPIDDKNC